jgi:hypothetical protein
MDRGSTPMTRIDLTLIRQLMDRDDPFGVQWTRWCYGKRVSKELAQLFEAYTRLHERPRATIYRADPVIRR